MHFQLVRFQAIFDRNRKDELPGLQLEWIDGICSPLYEVTLQASPLSGPHCHTSVFSISYSRCPSSAIVPPTSYWRQQWNCHRQLFNFLGSHGFLTEKDFYIFFIIFYYWKLWINFKVAFCSLENECALSDCEKKLEQSVWIESCDVKSPSLTVYFGLCQQQ